MSEQLQPDRVVLVGLDGSPAAATALPVACSIATQLGARVEGLHVLPPKSRAAKPKIESGGIEVRFQHGDPADEILRAGEAAEVLLVVLATHGHEVHLDGELAMIPRRVAARTSRPVLLVRPEASFDRHAARPFRSLLFPVDGTPSTAAACGHAAELLRYLAAEINVLFVVHPNQAAPDERGSMVPPYYVDQPQYEWPAWRGRVAKWIQCHCKDLPRDTVIQAHVATCGSRAEIGSVIAQFAADRVDDVIVLVRSSRMESGRATILRDVLDRTPCPVLIVASSRRDHLANPSPVPRANAA